MGTLIYIRAINVGAIPNSYYKNSEASLRDLQPSVQEGKNKLYVGHQILSVLGRVYAGR